MTGDPHIRGAHGDHADFKGIDHGIYCLLSTQRLALNVQFEHAQFFTPYSKMLVKGSWIRHVFWTMQTGRGELLRLPLNAYNPEFNHSKAARTVVVHDVEIIFEPKSGVKQGALTVRTPAWRTRAEVTKGPPHWGILRVNVDVQPMYATATDAVAPQ
eukprot:2674823-Prymnesium_polylepis.1